MLLRFIRFYKYISNISQSIKKIAANEMKKHGLKGSHVQYLAALDRYREGLTPSELCEICDRDKAAVSRAVAQMEGEGMIYRKDDDSHTYRIKLFLTEKGEAAAAIIRDCAAKAVQIAGKGISASQLENFYEVLQGISKNLDDLSQNGFSSSDQQDTPE